MSHTINFKTSYVTVYHYKRARGNCNGVISKHRMLLFILKTKMPPQGVSHFKTSYVTVYRQFPTAPGRRKYISKHRMLLFIADAPELFEQIKTISKHRMLLFIEGIGLKKGQGVYFKTSYVTVYRAQSIEDSEAEEFQNIVCYCLSVISPGSCSLVQISKHRMLLFIAFFPILRPRYLEFQNIVCYCLSGIGLVALMALNYFKTSYVTVYQGTAPQPRYIPQNFKTSYVTVYHNNRLTSSVVIFNFKTSYVTVYLKRGYHEWWFVQFQNIVCYCLSLRSGELSALQWRFQNIVCYCLSCSHLPHYLLP